MKKIFLTVIISTLCLHLFSQKLFSLKIGSSYSMISGLDIKKFSPYSGYHLGLGFDYIFLNPIGLKTEVIYETRGFSNEETTITPLRKNLYTNSVNSSNLYIPILLSRHYKRLYFEFGPHFNFGLNSKQKENYKEIWRDNSKTTDSTYLDQQNLSTVDFGLTLNVAFKLFSKVDLSIGISQNYSNLGKEYSWQHYRIFHSSIVYRFGKEFVPTNLKNIEASQMPLTERYAIRSSKNTNTSFHRISDGNEIVLLFRNSSQLKTISDLIIDESSGIINQDLSQPIISNLSFPCHIRVRFNETNLMNSQVVECFLEFDVYEAGKWEVTFR